MKVFFIFCFFLIAWNVQATESSEQEKEIFTLILQNNSEVKSAWQKYNEVRVSVLEVLSEYLPDAELNIRKGDVNVDIDPGVNGVDEFEFDEESYNLEVTQKIFEVGSITKLSAARKQVKADYLRFVDFVASSYLQAIKLYLEVLELEKNFAYSKAELDLLKKNRKITKIRNRGGVTSDLDYLQIQAEYLRVKSNFLEVAKNLTLKKAKLKYFIGKDLEVQELEQKHFKQGVNLDNILTEIKTSNIQLKIAKIDKEIYKKLKYIEFSNFGPVAELYYKSNNNEDSYSFYNSSISDTKIDSVGIEITVPLFKSGASISKIRQASKRYLAKKYDLISLQDSLEYEAVEIWENYSVLNSIIRTRESFKKYANNALTLAESNYKYGNGNILELFEAKKKLLEAQRDLVKAQNENIYNYFRYLYLKGKITPSLFSIDKKSLKNLLNG